MFFRVLLGSFESGVADRSGVAARMLHETCVGADAAERSIVLFRVEWLQSAMKGYLIDGCSNDRFDVFFAAL